MAWTWRRKRGPAQSSSRGGASATTKSSPPRTSTASPWCSPASGTSGTEPMKLLVIGSGGREHALAWKLAHSPRVSRVIVAPGNAGTAREEVLANAPAASIPEWIELARREAVGYTVVGPEAPLAEGIVDAFQAAGLRIFGPTQSAARLESSKEFAKSFMQRHGIPSAAYAAFSEAAPAHAYLERHGAPVVIKADGLAAGKGVVVAMDAGAARAAIDGMLIEKKMGAAGSRVVIEDYLGGEEASFIVLADGRHALPLATSQDHKRLLDGDRGPNTGGMGAYSPAPVVTPAVHARVMREVIEHALAGTLDRVEAEWDRRIALAVVLAAHGYPDAPRKGDTIRGLPAPGEDCHVFHAGTALSGKDVVTAGGRVLTITALGGNVSAAQRRAYTIAEGI